ncbi:hypothetical protein D9M69_554160 [compost metagenome]
MPTPLPERVGAASRANCWPLKYTNWPSFLPTTSAVSSGLSMWRCRRSPAVANRASPYRLGFFRNNISAVIATSTSSGKAKPIIPLLLITPAWAGTSE